MQTERVQTHVTRGQHYAMQARCPRCNAGPFNDCRTPEYEHLPKTTVHRARVEAYVGVPQE